MGVAGLWGHVRKEGMRPPLHHSPRVPSTSHTKVRTDVAGTFHTTIRWAYGQYNSNLTKAHSILENEIRHLSDQSQLVLYIDGGPAQEKLDTHIRRKAARHQALQRADDALINLAHRIASNQRVRKSYFSKINKNLNQGFYWNLEHRLSFNSYMRGKGWTVIVCNTEADIAIATDYQPGDIAVSSDSDFLIYTSIETLYRPTGRGQRRRYLLYDKASVLATLCLTPKQMLLLGIVSRNDYGRNIATLGIATNHKLVKAIPDQEGMKGSFHIEFENSRSGCVFSFSDLCLCVCPIYTIDVASMVQLYLQNELVHRKNTELVTFSNAIQVYCSLTQELDTSSQDPQEHTIDYSLLRDKLDHLSKLLAQHKKNEQEARKTRRQANTWVVPEQTWRGEESA